MAICLINKGGGGVQSEDVTALKSEVLAGKTALTADSNDETIQGTMPLLSPNSDMPHVMMCFDRGAGDYWGKGGVIDSPMHGRGVIVSMRPEDLKKYALDDRAVFVYMPVPDLRSENIRADKNIAKIQGGIPIWDIRSSGWGDVMYAWADQGHVWDHPIAGRGICSKIPNGHIIEGANWVFLKAPTILPENVRAGTPFLNIVGTLVDYGAGGTAFNGATFDGTLALGVADKGFDYNGTYYARRYLDNYAYTGVWGGGINFYMSTAMTAVRGRYIGCALTASINLTPFSRIVIDYRAQGTIQNNPYIALKVFVSRASAIIRNHSTTPEGWKIDDLGVVLAEGSNAASQNGGQMTINVSGINEHAFIAFGAMADIAGSNNNVFAGSMQITKIEFFN